jgi:hypothetical protein
MFPVKSAIGLLLLIAAGCAGTYVVPFTVRDVAADKHYGYDRDHPIKVGGFAEGRGGRHIEAFLSALRGPESQPVSYIGNGTCCSFLLDPDGKARGRLEVVLVSYRGISKPVILYFDTYHLDDPRAPAGFGAAAPGAASTH